AHDAGSRRSRAEEEELVVQRTGIPDGADPRGVQEQRAVRVHVDFLARIGHARPEDRCIGIGARRIVGRKLDIAERKALAARRIRVAPTVHAESTLPRIQRLAGRARDTEHRVAAAADSVADPYADRRFTAAALLGAAGLNGEVEAFE